MFNGIGMRAELLNSNKKKVKCKQKLSDYKKEQRKLREQEIDEDVASIILKF